MKLSLGASIVLYRTPVRQIQDLLDELLEQGATRLYLIDNSPLSFDTFGAWSPPDNVAIVRTGINMGYGAGHNVAIADSMRRHRYHLVCNPDIRLGPDVLQRLHEVMDARPEVGLVMPQVVGPDGQRHYLCKRSPSPLDFLPSWTAPASWRARRRAHFEMRDYSYDAEMQPECLSGCFMFLRNSVLARVQGFDDRFFMYFEDFDLSRRIRKVADNLYYPHVRVIHEHQRGHRRSLRLLRIFGTSAFKYFNKWGWRESAGSRQGNPRGERSYGGQ